MASAKYPSFLELLLGGDIDLISDTIKAVTIDAADYTYNAAHDFLNDVPSGARVGTPGTLSGKSITAGVFDASDTTVTSVGGSDPVENVLLFKDTGVESTSPLICLIDTFSGGSPLTPDGGNVLITWDNGSNKIFAIG